MKVRESIGDLADGSGNLISDDDIPREIKRLSEFTGEQN